MIKSILIAALAALSFSAVAQETTVHREVTRVERQHVERHVDRDMDRRHDRWDNDRHDRWDNGRRGHERVCVIKKRVKWVDGRKIVTKYRHCDNGRRGHH